MRIVGSFGSISHRWGIRAGAVVLATALVGAPTLQLGGGEAHGEPEEAGHKPSSLTDEIPFFAGGLLALSDADMRAQAYIDDEIGPAIGDRDTLALIRSGAGFTPDVRETEVSNSVWGVPTALVGVTPDGDYAFVPEVRRRRDRDDRSFMDDLTFSTRVSVVDLRGKRPRVVQVADSGGFAAYGLSVSPRGDYVAVSNWAAPGEESGIPEGGGRQISIMPFRNGRLGRPQLFGMNDIPGPNVFPNTIAWHPSGRYLALTVGLRNLVAFYRVTETAGSRLDVEPWGRPVQTGPFPFPGVWTPDGRFFIAGVMEWNEVDVTDANAPPGSLAIVRFDPRPADGLRHTLGTSGHTGINPEGLAISPDGRHLVTVNLRYSHLPDGYDRLRPPTTSSITLLTFDRNTGETEVVDERTFDGILPQGVVFDRTGTHVAHAVFDVHAAKSGRGAVRFWRVQRDGEPRLEPLPTEISTVRGTHALAVVP
jgi:hypothetical protein